MFQPSIMESNQVYKFQYFIYYLVPSCPTKTNFGREGVTLLYSLSIQSKCFVAMMNEIVGSMIVLFSTTFKCLALCLITFTTDCNPHHQDSQSNSFPCSWFGLHGEQ